MTPAPILTSPLQTHIEHAIAASGGWIGFDKFMHAALYTPGLGYYANDLRKFGLMPGGQISTQGGGSDFVTAPEMSPRFGGALARQIRQALYVTQTSEVWEFGAGSGALAEQILQALPLLEHYTIVDVSGSLRARQQQRLEAFAGRVSWATRLPDRISGIVIGNEVLDAMPVKILARTGGVWHERGVALHEGGFAYADHLTALRPPVDSAGVGEQDYVTEIHPQAEGFICTLADKLDAGALLMVDYGFPEHEYYHPQRSMGTVMCHRAHLVDADPLTDVGRKDITAHINFTGIAMAGQGAGLNVLGYTGQGRFLLNCGVLDGMGDAIDAASLAGRTMVQKLINEHEMGELFKVIAFGAKNTPAWQPMGFAQGDRSHTL